MARSTLTSGETQCSCTHEAKDSALKRGLRGFTLIELLVAIAVLTLIGGLLYGSFSGLERTRVGVSRIADRYHQGRSALRRMAIELQSAYISAHVPINPSLQVQSTAFIGTRDSPACRLDFNAFANRRLDRNAKESDQAEISYFGGLNPDGSGDLDLLRRVSSRLDLEPDRGGRVQVLATDIDSFQLSYLDASTGMWTESWDSTQALEQHNRLPLQVRVHLTLNGGRRRDEGRSRQPIRFMTKIALALRNPLTFAME